MKETMKEQITVREFCLKQTQVGELCVCSETVDMSQVPHG